MTDIVKLLKTQTTYIGPDNSKFNYSPIIAPVLWSCLFGVFSPASQVMKDEIFLLLSVWNIHWSIDLCFFSFEKKKGNARYPSKFISRPILYAGIPVWQVSFSQITLLTAFDKRITVLVLIFKDFVNTIMPDKKEEGIVFSFRFDLLLQSNKGSVSLSDVYPGMSSCLSSHLNLNIMAIVEQQLFH